MSAVKGGGGPNKQCGGGGKIEIWQDPCEPVVPCQNTNPGPEQCIGPVDPCQVNQSGGIGGGYNVTGGYGGQVSQGGHIPQGGQVSHDCGGVKK